MLFARSLKENIAYNFGTECSASELDELVTDQGAVKHGRGNGYGAPDLCVMHGPPVYTCKFANIFANESNKTLGLYKRFFQWIIGM